MTRLLIVSFTFPPYSGIGGRRWAKFIKCLNREGINCQVISATKGNEKNSPWEKDTLGYAGKITFIKPPYPQILMTNPKSIIQKLNYKLALWKVKQKKKEINYYDYSTGFGYAIKPLVEKAIRQGTKNVLISVGPFHMAWELLALKKVYPDVNFMVDFRDPWSNNKTSFGFAEMLPEALLQEQKKEREVIQGYDFIFAVSGEMNDYFKAISGVDDHKFINLPNGFDPEDLNTEILNSDKRGDKLNLLLLGTLYGKTKPLFDELNEALIKLKHDNPGFYQKIAFNFCGEVPQWFGGFKEQHSNIIYHGKKQYQQAAELARNSDAVMLFLTDDLNFSMSTKFYEGLAMKKPIIVFSSKGKTAEYVEQNQIGLAINKGSIYEDLLHLCCHYQQGQLKFNPEFNTTEFEINNLINKVIATLK
jgi:glycosyltransferase involved in cell wall biosynthesis